MAKWLLIKMLYDIYKREVFVSNNCTYHGNVTNKYTTGNPDSNVHGANIGPTWVLSAPGGPHIGPINLAIRVLMPPISKWIAHSLCFQTDQQRTALSPWPFIMQPEDYRLFTPWHMNASVNILLSWHAIIHQDHVLISAHRFPPSHSTKWSWQVS